ncbi:MAG: transglutaminase family protein [Ruminococcus sp.]|nr:transglutaminase family protein [Ruminococcus sp.]
MKRIRFEYVTSLKLSVPAKEHCFSIRVLPRSTPRQRIQELSFSLFPKTAVWENSDSYGNKIISGRYDFYHLHFQFTLSGTAITDCTAIDKSGLLDCYRYPSRLTMPGSEITQFYNAIKDELGDSPYERAMNASARLYEIFSYEQAVTNVKTTAEEAFKQKKGVCQDYAHIFLSLMRLDGIACRYAAGLFAGEGQTHGWAEIFDGGWIGIDPTNNCRVGDDYIRLSHGRDFSDSAIDRGVIYSLSSQIQTVSAFLTEEK